MTLTDLYMHKTAGLVGSAANTILGKGGAEAARAGYAGMKGAQGFGATAKAGWEGAKNTFKNMGAKRQIAAVAVPTAVGGYALGKHNS